MGWCPLHLDFHPKWLEQLSIPPQILGELNPLEGEDEKPTFELRWGYVNMEKPPSPAPAPRRDRSEYLRAHRQRLLLGITVSKAEGSLPFRAVLLQNTWGNWNLTQVLGRWGASVRRDEGRDKARKVQRLPWNAAP